MPDLKSIGGWQPIVKHLTDPDDEIVLRACWVCGTAVQVRPPLSLASLAFEHTDLVLSSNAQNNPRSLETVRGRPSLCFRIPL